MSVADLPSAGGSEPRRARAHLLPCLLVCRSFHFARPPTVNAEPAFGEAPLGVEILVSVACQLQPNTPSLVLNCRLAVRSVKPTGHAEKWCGCNLQLYAA